MIVCKVDGCERKAVYKAAAMCQKHYFRQRRNGHTRLLLDIKRERLGYSRQQRLVMPGKGYIRVYAPDHPLRDSRGYVAEHRKVVYSRYGEHLPYCEICGSATDWATCHIDHIDEDVANNREDNLRPLCRDCNIGRTKVPGVRRANAIPITVGGVTLTAEEWARQPGVKCSGGSIRRRIKAGWPPHDAVYGEKITHNGRRREKPPTPPRHTRKNAIRLTIDGVMKTAAEWSRHPECPVAQETIVARKKSGMDDSDCVFMPPRAGAKKR